MSILIKGMEMPKNCDDCRFQYRSYDTFVKFCQLHLDMNNFYDIDEIITKRGFNCPLVEVPTPHGRLIDADALLEHKTDHDTISTHLVWNAPTVIESEE